MRQPSRLGCVKHQQRCMHLDFKPEHAVEGAVALDALCRHVFLAMCASVFGSQGLTQGIDAEG